MFLAENYFDEREQRTKPVPDCSRVGATWDHRTQRCERPRAMSNYGLLYTGEDYLADGLGFLPALAPAAAAAGPPGWVVLGIASIGQAILSIFGGGDDQQTSYRPPANSSTQFVQFNDAHGHEAVAYDVSAASLAEAARRGNRADDIYSYFSGFISNSTNAGASSAARRVMEDASKKHGISIARAADWLLNTAGIHRIVQSFLPSNQGGGSTPRLPPACGVGTYHPYPIGHPQQDECVPFPGWENGPPQGTPKPTATPGGLQIPHCPTGQARYPQTLKCVPIQCPTGTRRNPLSGLCIKSTLQGAVPGCPDSRMVYDLRTRRCVLPGSAEARASEETDEKEGLELSGNWLWLLLLAGGVFVVSQRR